MKKTLLWLCSMAISFSLFGIDGLVVKTIDYSFQEKWYKTISSTIPRLIEIDTIYKNQTFYLTAIAWDFALDENDSAHTVYSIKITKPDGSIYFSQGDLPLYNEKVVRKDLFQMSDAVLTISLENEEETGKYLIEVEILDKNSSKTKQIKTSIYLKDLPSYKTFQVTEKKEFLSWIEKYYRAPNPQRALSYYLYYVNSPLSEDDNTFLPIFSIFTEIFKNNKFLYPEILNCYNEQDERTKIFLIYLLHYSELGTKEFYSSLDETGKEAYQQILKSSLPDMYGEINDPAQLDMLWSTFATGGSYKPILKLIQTMDYAKFKGDLDKFKDSKQTEEDRQKAINNAIYDSLVWSFTSNCQQHQLVSNYAKWALKNEELSVIQRSELKKILDDL